MLARGEVLDEDGRVGRLAAEREGMFAGEIREGDAGAGAQPLALAVEEREPRHREGRDVLRALHQLVERGERDVRIKDSIRAQARDALLFGGEADGRVAGHAPTWRAAWSR